MIPCGKRMPVSWNRQNNIHPEDPARIWRTQKNPRGYWVIYKGIYLCEILLDLPLLQIRRIMTDRIMGWIYLAARPLLMEELRRIVYVIPCGKSMPVSWNRQNNIHPEGPTRIRRTQKKPRGSWVIYKGIYLCEISLDLPLLQSRRIMTDSIMGWIYLSARSLLI